ncbi:cystatin-like [Myripristis murdjan]|uniref:cystatin-like n=1 Tax=Myripristis murdjan TaxID=586833 RepID=UPI0011760D38|nr:cystatin-like [Myripristis murdjan]
MTWKIIIPLLMAFFEGVVPTSPVPGGLVDIPDIEHNNNAREALNFAVSEHNAKGNSITREITLLRAQSQVVSGVKYVFDVRLEDVQCNNSSSEKGCTCKFEVWSKPRENWKQVTVDTCQ